MLQAEERASANVEYRSEKFNTPIKESRMRLGWRKIYVIFGVPLNILHDNEIKLSQPSQLFCAFKVSTFPRYFLNALSSTRSSGQILLTFVRKALCSFWVISAWLLVGKNCWNWWQTSHLSDMGNHAISSSWANDWTVIQVDESVHFLGNEFQPGFPHVMHWPGEVLFIHFVSQHNAFCNKSSYLCTHVIKLMSVEILGKGWWTRLLRSFQRVPLVYE